MRTIVIAIFIKDDFIQRQIDNILALDGLGDYRVVFVQDNPRNSPKYDSEHHRKKRDNVGPSLIAICVDFRVLNCTSWTATPTRMGHAKEGLTTHSGTRVTAFSSRMTSS